MSLRPAFAGGSHDRQNRRVGRKEGIDPRGEFVARPTPVASAAESGMDVEEIERLAKESAGVMIGHGWLSVRTFPIRQTSHGPFPPTARLCPELHGQTDG